MEHDDERFYSGASRGDFLDAMTAHAGLGSVVAIAGDTGSGVSTLLGQAVMALLADMEVVRIDGSEPHDANVVVDALLRHFDIDRAELPQVLRDTLSNGRLVVVVGFRGDGSMVQIGCASGGDRSGRQHRPWLAISSTGIMLRCPSPPRMARLSTMHAAHPSSASAASGCARAAAPTSSSTTFPFHACRVLAASALATKYENLRLAVKKRKAFNAGAEIFEL